MNYIYIHTNKENGKVYIGQTNRDPEKRWGKGRGYKGSKRFYSAIKKYGWDGFEHEILISDVDDSTVNFWETYFINYYDSTNREKGYNLTSGGKENFKHNEETKQKMSSTHKGKPSHNKGVPMSEEQKQKLSNVHKGKKHSDETKQKMSSIRKGENNPMFGKKLSEEAKQKMSSSHKGKHWKLDPITNKRIYY